MAILPATSFAGRWGVAQVARANAPLFLIHTIDHVSIPPTWPARGHMCAVMMALLFLPMCLFSNPQMVPQASDTVFYYVDIICLELPYTGGPRGHIKSPMGIGIVLARDMPSREGHALPKAINL